MEIFMKYEKSREMLPPLMFFINYLSENSLLYKQTKIDPLTQFEFIFHEIIFIHICEIGNSSGFSHEFLVSF